MGAANNAMARQLRAADLHRQSRCHADRDPSLLDERHVAHALVVLMICGGLALNLCRATNRRFAASRSTGQEGTTRFRPAISGRQPAETGRRFGWPIYRLHQELIGPAATASVGSTKRVSRVDGASQHRFHVSKHSMRKNRLWVVLNLGRCSGRAARFPATIDRLGRRPYGPPKKGDSDGDHACRPMVGGILGEQSDDFEPRDLCLRRAKRPTAGTPQLQAFLSEDETPFRP